MPALKIIGLVLLAPLILAGWMLIVCWAMLKYLLIMLWWPVKKIATGVYFLFLWPVHLYATRRH